MTPHEKRKSETDTQGACHTRDPKEDQGIGLEKYSHGGWQTTNNRSQDLEVCLHPNQVYAPSITIEQY